jgi:hypothetical protein
MILTAKSIFGSLQNYFDTQLANIRNGRGIVLVIGPVSGNPIHARIYQGQWIADCECNGASFVDPEDPRFFCFSCGNRANNNNARPVIFPEDRTEIERLLLLRPVNDSAGLTDADRAGLARPLVGALSRNWIPGETVKDLHDQQDKALKQWSKK